jgi:hypothetical protein
MFSSDDGLVRGIEAAPYQGEVAVIVVKEALVGKAGMVSIWLFEFVLMSAGRAGDCDHGTHTIVRFP